VSTSDGSGALGTGSGGRGAQTEDRRSRHEGPGGNLTTSKWQF